MDTNELLKTAALAQLELNENEIPRFAEAVSRMLDNFALMSEFSTASVSDSEPADKVSSASLRRDVPVSNGNNESLLNNAPERDDRFFVIPNVL